MKVSKFILGLALLTGGMTFLAIAQANTQNTVQDEQDTLNAKQDATQDAKNINVNALIIEDDDN